ncbi:MAG: hypothetical protein ACKVJE_17300 [Pseudomonadales bacterium]
MLGEYNQFQTLDHAKGSLDMCIGVLFALGSNPDLTSIGSDNLSGCLSLLTEKLEEVRSQIKDIK